MISSSRSGSELCDIGEEESGRKEGGGLRCKLRYKNFEVYHKLPSMGVISCANGKKTET